jgi:ABC-type uncharacterized transport system ATPase subunit
MIALDRISKSFSGVPALRDVSLTLQSGRVHGILGENGAGKSTLMNILFGLLRPDAGTISLDGKAVVIGSPRRAQRLGIGMVHQHFKLVPPLRVVDNFALGVRRGIGPIHRRSIAEQIEQLAAPLRWSIDPWRRIDQLSVGQQQRVEILKALAIGARVLILDEPTAVLTPQEADELLPALRTLATGGAAIAFISHKLNEVSVVCDDVTILRRGAVIRTGAMGDLSRAQMAELMIGETLRTPAPNPPRTTAPERLLSVADLSLAPPRQSALLRDISFTVDAGEIVGIAGVDGNGQGPLAETLIGLRRPTAGDIQFTDRSILHHTVRERRNFIGYIPEDRRREGLVLPLSIESNLLLKRYREPEFSRLGFIRRSAWRTYATALRQQFDVRAAHLSNAVGTLSGGNQQKVILARELEPRPPLILAVNPTRGLDIGATGAVMDHLRAARARHAGVLLIHADLDELLAIADRVLVMVAGTLRDSGWPNTTRDRIGQLMLGAA